MFILYTNGLIHPPTHLIFTLTPVTPISHHPTSLVLTLISISRSIYLDYNTNIFRIKYFIYLYIEITRKKIPLILNDKNIFLSYQTHLNADRTTFFHHISQTLPNLSNSNIIACALLKLQHLLKQFFWTRKVAYPIRHCKHHFLPTCVVYRYHVILYLCNDHMINIILRGDNIVSQVDQDWIK